MVKFSQGLHYLLTPMVLREPDLMTVSAWQGHVPFAFWIVEALRPKMLVELGTHTGFSYCAFCQAVQEKNMDTSCYAVDTWKGDSQSHFYGEEVFQTLAVYHEPRYSAFSRLLRSTFDQALEHFSDGSIDLLHIDGCHTYEAVKHDFTSWQPKLSERAVVLFHDTNVRERDFGVWRFWEEIIPQYPAFEFLHYHGLGVLAVGQHLPKPLNWLLNISTRVPEQVSLIRDFFARLGKVIVDQWLNRELNALAASRAGDIQTRDRHIQTLDGDIQTLQGVIAALDGDIQTLQGVIAARDGDIQSLQSENQALQDTVATRDARIANIYQSISWRLTSPLRTVDRWLKIRQ
jgi:O-antigen biosynthesis protein